MTFILEAGPYNGPNDADAAMQWVDITTRCLDRVMTPEAGAGRQTELERVDTGRLTLTLGNSDHAVTPGNLSSPYAPGWRTGMRIRYRETVGARTFTILDGNLYQPETTVRTPGVDQTVTVTVLDRLGGLAAGRRMTSTLAEWIRYNAGPNLVAYWTMGESAFPYTTGADVLPIFGGGMSVQLVGQPDGSTPVFAAAAGSALVGDDLPRPVWSPQAAADAVVYARLASPITISTGQAITVIAWMRADGVAGDVQSYVIQLTSTAVPDYLFVRRTTDSPLEIPPHSLLLQAGQVASWTVTATGTEWVQGHDVMVGAQLVLGASPTTSIWSDGLESTSNTLSGVPAATMTFDRVEIGGDFSGSLSHIQVYAGDPALWGRTQALAQSAAGRSGLSGQYAGDRIRTIARYAGMTDAELGDVAQGETMLGRASLAGRYPLDAMRDAERTDQGLLHARGRRLVYHPKSRRYW
jgi:hypothetical protein